MRSIRFLSLGMCFFVLVACSNSTPTKPPFSYDLHLCSTDESDERAVICFHGFGGDCQMSRTVTPFFKEKASVISFNFPDYGKRSDSLNPEETYFGTIDEILPALYVLKQTIIDKGFSQVCLYGFSAGAAALINCISVLNTSIYDVELKSIGIRKKEKREILDILQQGDIVLDTPLKSIDELISVYGMTKELEVIGTRYQKNGMDPIDSLKNWDNLSLNVLVHFQIPDEIVSNRDDAYFIETIKKYNRGITEVFIGNDSGHLLPHPSLWKHHLVNCRCF